MPGPPMGLPVARFGGNGGVRPIVRVRYRTAPCDANILFAPKHHDSHQWAFGLA